MLQKQHLNMGSLWDLQVRCNLAAMGQSDCSENPSRGRGGSGLRVHRLLLTALCFLFCLRAVACRAAPRGHGSA